MILIAESGSTKTDWKWIDSGESFQTSGYNPYVQGMDSIIKILDSELLPLLENQNPNAIYFYGSGFSHPDFNNALRKWFLSHTTAGICEVEHDLLGAARAICLNAAGIAVILGTGSNSCLYDGQQIIAHKGGHGYLFGDEGSGADLGKRLVKAVLDQEFPPSLSEEILDRLQCQSPVELRNRIHGKPKPNVSLAALAPLVLELASHPEIESLILNSFRAFCQTTLLRYPEIETVSPGFTGSIAIHFQQYLLRVLKEYGLNPSIFVDKPIDRLALYHERFR